MTSIDLSYRPESYWPDDHPPDEGVIRATISLGSVLGDEIWVTALPHESGIRLRVHGEGDCEYAAQPETASGPLLLADLIELIDSVFLGDGIARGLVYGLLDCNFMIGSGNREDADFISVSSEIYPGLFEHYCERSDAWVMGEDDAR